MKYPFFYISVIHVNRSMALSVEKLLSDAHTLIINLKDHDTLADSIIATTQGLYNKVEAMKQVME